MSETVRTDARYCRHGGIPLDKTRTWDTETCRQCAREEAEAASALATIEEQRQRIDELEEAADSIAGLLVDAEEARDLQKKLADGFCQALRSEETKRQAAEWAGDALEIDRDEWKKRAEQAESERDALREALREIRIGKVQADNDHPLGEYAAMVFRFMEIARRTLARNPEGPK